MAGTRRVMINGGIYSNQRIAGRPIPKRGQVKLAIVLGLAHSFASIFSRSSSRSTAAFSFRNFPFLFCLPNPTLNSDTKTLSVLHHSNIKLSEEEDMAGSRRAMINGGIYSSQRIAGRPIPKRGQVKLAIVLGLAHSFASVFCWSSSRSTAAFSSR
ncbi:hypothetical protein DITRI_Ditri02bG0026300 [Diplodiscus trichospermus]